MSQRLGPRDVHGHRFANRCSAFIAGDYAGKWLRNKSTARQPRLRKAPKNKCHSASLEGSLDEPFVTWTSVPTAYAILKIGDGSEERYGRCPTWYLITTGGTAPDSPVSRRAR